MEMAAGLGCEVNGAALYTAPSGGTCARARAHAGPTLLVVDDIDRLSGLELNNLSMVRGRTWGPGYVWLMSRRTGPEARRLEARLSLPQEKLVRIPLGGLGATEAAQLAVDIVEAPLSPPLADLVDRTGGHPGLVVELVTGLLEEGMVRICDTGAVPVGRELPERLHSWMDSVLAECTSECRQFVRVLATCGGDGVPVERAGALLGAERPAALLPLVDEARANGILTRGPEPAFQSAITRRLIAESVPLGFRRALREEADAAPAADRSSAGHRGRRLTDKEREIVGLIAEGLTSRQVARRMLISPNTVDYHVKKLFRAYRVSCRAELVHAVLGRGGAEEPGREGRRHADP
ncbi:helix-turn-helix transcriptional regulator [Nocardiopsis halophila]|uniref:helix-turn-helix transcriptional regulator n=1 Tax=Nocardiopsis halophila TaxID=141692 RepID=UPI001267D294|nr:helix-turn-helix transcriptional regulator [Nocardiopsis halophila]